MSDTIEALKKALPAQDPAEAAIIEKMVAEHKAAEEIEEAERINPFDLIQAGGVVKIQTQDEADSVTDVIVRADQALENAKALAAAMVARAESKARRLRAIFESALGRWAKWQLEGKKRRSLILEHGQLQLRKKAVHNQTFCEPDLIAWAEVTIPNAITYKASVSMEDVKAWEEKNGKPAPGRIHVDEEEKFSIRVPDVKEE